MNFPIEDTASISPSVGYADSSLIRGSHWMVRSRKAPLCKGSCHGEAVTEGLCSCAKRKNSGLCPLLQILSFLRPKFAAG